jgi:Uma2 family endonuclease
MPVRLGEGHFREPDIVYVKSSRIADERRPPNGADLVIEVVSPGKKNRKRDLQTKRRAYARARIAEYWIVDPHTQTITVLTLSARTYKAHGAFKPGDRATSKLLVDFWVDVTAAFAAGSLK